MWFVPNLGTFYQVPNIGTMFKSLHSKEYSLLVGWLKEQRLGQKLTMRDLGAKLGVPHSLIGKVEQGERRLDVIEFLQYCNALKVDPIEGMEKIMESLVLR